MNYYDHHIRDYDAATSHLTWEEDMAYTRMLRWYYRKEKPLPVDVAEVCRQIRAASKPQRDAVASVLREFFTLQDDGWHKDDCDDAIAAFQAGEPERVAKKKNEDTRLSRHRTERSELFAVINGAGQHLNWNTPIAELRAAAERIKLALQATAPATKPATPATAPATPATATQYPVPTPHSPDTSVLKEPPSVDGGGAQPAADAPAPANLIPGCLPDGELPCPHQALIELFHEVLPMARRIRDWTPARAQVLRARWKEQRKRQNLTYWRELFEYVGKSAWLTGRKTGANGRAFELSLEWLVKAENFAKVREGAYHDAEEVAA